MENLSQKEKIYTPGNSSNGLSSYVNNSKQSEKSFSRKTDDIKKNESLNKSSYRWMYSKLLSYYAVLVLGLFSLTFFDVASIEVFITGVFSGFSICIALIGHGIVDLLKDDKNAILDLWGTQEESSLKT